jgi:hypothetical protein
MKSRTFPYQKVARLSVFPMLPLQLQSKNKTANETALVDSGAGMSVLPFEIGERLGLDWDNALVGSGLGKIVKPEDSRFVFLDVFIEPFLPFKNIFLWVKTNEVRLIVGQANFLAHFDVLLSARKQEFTLFEAGEA